MKLNYIYILIGILTIKSLSAQDSTRVRYLYSGSGLMIESAQDKAMSPLRYDGPGFLANSGYYRESDKSIHDFSMGSAIGILQTRNWETDNTACFFLLPEMQYSFLHQIKKFNYPGKIYIGGTFDWLMNFRLNPKIANSALNYESLAGITLTGTYIKNFKIPAKEWDFWIFALPVHEQDLKFSFNLKLPIITHVMRPNYITLPDIVDNDPKIVKDHFKRSKIESLGNLFWLKSKMALSKRLKNGNMFDFSYTWELYKYKAKYNPVVTASHTITISKYFRLN